MGSVNTGDRGRGGVGGDFLDIILHYEALTQIGLLAFVAILMTLYQHCPIETSSTCQRNANYGERYRNGERISTGFVESAVNQVISKRMAKRKQMQWSRRGAHLLLQVRTQVLNGEWEKTFRTWYPGFRQQAQSAAA
jgi:hypothetical protein